MTISLRQMRYVLAVARTGHFGRAAEACAISQPALSQQIIALEQICGAALFDRLKAGAVLTPFGRDFVALAGEALRHAEAVEAFALRHAGRPQRPLRFGLIPTVAPYLLPDIFPRLTAHLPDLQFAISESRTDALLSGISEGTLDLALIATEAPEGARLVTAPLFDDAFVLAAPSGAVPDAPVSLAALPPERILLLDEGHCFRDQTIAACRLDGARAARTFAATSLSTIVEFVANGQGMTLLPSIALKKEASDPRIAVQPLDDPAARRRLNLVWRQASPYERSFHQIADLIRAAAPRSP